MNYFLILACPLYLSKLVSIHHVYCLKQDVYWQLCGRCVYGILHLWQDSLYLSIHVSIHYVYCLKQDVYWQFCGRYVYEILQLRQDSFFEGLEGYFRDPGFDQNTVRESGKQQKSWRDPGFHCSPGSGTRQNLGTGCGISLACLSGIREIVTTQINVLAANANLPGER